MFHSFKQWIIDLVIGDKIEYETKKKLLYETRYETITIWCPDLSSKFFFAILYVCIAQDNDGSIFAQDLSNRYHPICQSSKQKPSNYPPQGWHIHCERDLKKKREREKKIITKCWDEIDKSSRLPEALKQEVRLEV